jgi:aspartate/methionine/tyrosine aminotransferase
MPVILNRKWQVSRKGAMHENHNDHPLFGTHVPIAAVSLRHDQQRVSPTCAWSWCRMGSVKFAVERMDRANVAVTPGAGFDEEGDGCLRSALVENENRIRQGLKQIRRALT